MCTHTSTDADHSAALVSEQLIYGLLYGGVDFSLNYQSYSRSAVRMLEIVPSERDSM
jgi:hypothetical protein